MNIEHVLWITLASRKDRHRAFGRNMEQLGSLPVQRITAVDAYGLHITNQWSSGLIQEGAASGIVGCYLSHLQAIQFAALTGRLVLVLEDDVVLHENFLALVELEIAKAGTGWTILNVSGQDRHGSKGAHAYVVNGRLATPVVEAMSSERHGGVVVFMREHSDALGILTSAVELAHQNKALSTDLTSTLRRWRRNISPNEIAARSWSQYGEDDLIVEFFAMLERKENRRFLEIGAFDGVKDSNCHKLALLGWKGVCVEPNPYHFIRLHQTYQNDEAVEVLCAMVGRDSDIRTLHLSNDGLSTSHPDIFTALKDKVYFPSFCRAAVVTPDQIVARFGCAFDFVSIDAEGMDLDILRASKDLLSGTSLICVEADMPGSEPSAGHCEERDAILRDLGFNTVIGITKGNLLLKRSTETESL